MQQYLKSCQHRQPIMQTHCQTCNVPLISIESDSTKVCPECGCVMKLIPVTQTGFGENVFVCVYSRTKRFEIMLKSLLYPSFDKKDTTMYQHLEKYTKFPTIEELKSTMKLCSTKEKRFHSLHLFASLLCTDYKELIPPTQEYFKLMMRIFDEVLCRFNATQSTKFFSYPWLIRRLLNLTGETRYNKYIKKIRCKKRNLYYVHLFEKLVATAPKSYFICVCGMNKCGAAAKAFT
jgi:hypothetical protein